jgi:hypothetical protein
MYGDLVDHPPGMIVLHPHWQYLIKHDGTCQSWNCCDGSPHAAPMLHGVASTYSSCMEQPVQWLFFALAAQMGYKVYGGDATDAFAYSPLPKMPTYVAINDAYANWYEHTFGKVLDHSQVLHALQVHPKSGCLWEVHIGKILHELEFITTIHDWSIYCTTVDGKPVLLLWQVDDFAMACPSKDVAWSIYGKIGKMLQLPSELEPPFKYLGLLHDFNGLDVHQYSDSITISSTSYIEHILKTHGWMTPSAEGSEHHNSPLPVDAVTLMYSEVGHWRVPPKLPISLPSMASATTASLVSSCMPTLHAAPTLAMPSLP